MSTTTSNFNLVKPEITDSIPNTISNDLPNNFQTIDATIKSLDWQTATIVSRQIRVSKATGIDTIKFHLTSSIATGTVINISTDGGTTSLPLKDIEEVDILELEKGFYEVIADATFFTLRPSGKKLEGDNEAVSTSVSGTTLKLTPPKGCFDGEIGNNVTITDSDFIAANIKNLKNVFGLVGTYDAKKFAKGSQALVFPVSSATATISGLDFTPKTIILKYRKASNGYWYYRTYDTNATTGDTTRNGRDRVNWQNTTTVNALAEPSGFTVSYGQFSVLLTGQQGSDYTLYWFACE